MTNCLTCPLSLFFITIVIIVSSMLCACTGQDSLPKTPTAPTVPEPAESWSADGVIKAGEYPDDMQYAEYQIFWRNDSQYVYIAIRAKTSGFVAVGIQPGTRMKDADMIFGFVKDGVVTLLDLYSTGDFGPHPADTELGGSDDITEFGGSEEGGFTTIEFKRALQTTDKYDLPIAPGVNNIIWAYGSNDSLTGRHAARGYGEIDIK